MIRWSLDGRPEELRFHYPHKDGRPAVCAIRLTAVPGVNFAYGAFSNRVECSKPLTLDVLRETMRKLGRP